VGASGRRKFIRGVGAAGIAGLAGCSNGSNNSGGGSNNGGQKSSGATSGGTKSGSGMTLTYWTLFTGGDGVVMKSIIDRFNKQKPLGDVHIKRVRQPWAKYYQKLYTALSGGNPPDVAISHGYQLGRFVDYYHDLGSFITKKDKHYVGKTWDRAKVNGKRVALPLDTHPVGLYYNKDILDKVGASMPLKSADQFVQICNKIQNQTSKTPFIPDPYADMGFRQFTTSIHQLGGQLMTGDYGNRKPVIDTTAGKTAMTYYYNVAKGKYGWDKPDTSANRGTKAMQAGDVAFIVNGTWYVDVLGKQKKFKWDMTKPYITPGMKDLRSETAIHSIVMPKNPKTSDKRKQTAFKFMAWLTQKNPEWGMHAGHLNAWKPILDGSKIKSAKIWPKTLSKFKEMATNDQLVYLPTTKNMSMSASSNWQWLHDCYDHKVQPAQALKKGTKSWNSKL